MAEPGDGRRWAWGTAGFALVWLICAGMLVPQTAPHRTAASTAADDAKLKAWREKLSAEDHDLRCVPALGRAKVAVQLVNESTTIGETLALLGRADVAVDAARTACVDFADEHAEAVLLGQQTAALRRALNQ